MIWGGECNVINSNMRWWRIFPNNRKAAYIKIYGREKLRMYDWYVWVRKRIISIKISNFSISYYFSWCEYGRNWWNRDSKGNTENIKRCFYCFCDGFYYICVGRIQGGCSKVSHKGSWKPWKSNDRVYGYNPWKNGLRRKWNDLWFSGGKNNNQSGKHSLYRKQSASTGILYGGWGCSSLYNIYEIGWYCRIAAK